MRSGWRIAASGVLLVGLAGCDHTFLRTQKTVPPPPLVTAPSRPPSQMAELIPPMPDVPPVAYERPIRLDASVPQQEMPPAPETHTRRVRHKPRSTAAEPAQDTAKTPAPATPAPTVASSGQPSDNSIIGQLSPATSNVNTADRQALTDQLNATEKSLNELHRDLNSEERKTAELIRTFIGKARQALKTDDLDGAKNYSTKAKILLDELVKS